MQITSQIFYQHFLTGLQQNLQAELTDTDQISSTKKISRPSDDPGTLWKVVDYQTQLSGIDEYQKAMIAAKAQVQSIDSALSDVNTNLTRANELAISAGDGSQDPSTKLMISSEVQTIYNSAIATANTQVDGRYIFAGYQSNVNPIDPTTGEFISDANSVNIGIANGINLTSNVSAGSLFSFKRVNTTDSATAIKPSYNWTNDGANTIPDADPTSALQTTVPTYNINPGEYITIGGVQVTLNPPAPAACDASGFAAQLQSAIQAKGGSLANVTVSYDATNNKFDIGNGNGVNVSVNWGSTSLRIEQSLGFNSAGNQTILANSGIASDNTVGKFTTSGDIFTANGGSLDIKVGDTTTQSSGGFVINNSNNALVIDGTTYYIANGIYTGSGLANALTNKLSTNASGTPPIASPIIKASYDGTNHRFNITSAGATTVNFGNAAMTMGQILGFDTTDTGTIGSGITSDNTLGDLNLAANSTLQDVRDALNAASAGVKAEVVNEGTTANPDFRLVVASNPVGSSDKIDISVLSDPTTTGFQDPNGPPPAGINLLSYDKTTGTNMTLGTNITNYNYITQASANDSIVIDDGTNGGIANNKIVFQESGGANLTATIARGTYTHDQLATAIANALDAAAPAGDTYTAAYDPNSNKFTIASNAGNADTLTINWSNAGSTARQLLGHNATDESGALTISGANNTIGFNDGSNRTATIAVGTYTTGTALAAAIQSALNNTGATGSAINDFVVNYDPTANKFAISTSAAHAGLQINWTGAGSGTLNEAQIGFTAASSTVTTNPANATSASSVSFNGQSDNSVLANYYSFNNNYLNDNNILRALNFEIESLNNNDAGRISQSLKYLGDLTDLVSQTQASIGARENEITTEGNFETTTSTNIQTFMSNAQDTDIAKVSSDLAQRQATLTALRTITAAVLNQSLFDFVKF